MSSVNVARMRAQRDRIREAAEAREAAAAYRARLAYIEANPDSAMAKMHRGIAGINKAIRDLRAIGALPTTVAVPRHADDGA